MTFDTVGNVADCKEEINMAYARPWEFKNQWTTKVNVQVKLPEME